MSGSVQQSGPVCPGRPAVWAKNGTVADAGPPGEGNLSGIGITNDGNLALAINSGSISEPFVQLGFTVSSDGTITVGANSFNGAPVAELIFNINGVDYPFNPSGNGNITGPGSSVSGNLLAYNGTGGNLVEDSGIPAALVVHGPTVSVIGDLIAFSATSGNSVEDTGIPFARVVQGPTVAVIGNLPAFADTEGNLIEDSEIAASDIVLGPTAATAGNIAVFNGTSGKLVKDSGYFVSTAMQSFVESGSLAAALHLLPYTLNATGATARAVDVKLRDVVSALDFAGIDQSGSTDCTAGLQALINYLQSIGGGTGIIPAGTYKIIGTLTITASNVVLLGTSEYGTVLNFANGSADGIQVGFQGSALKGVMISTMSLVGVGKTGGNMINAQNYANSVFANLSIRGAFNGMALSILNNCTVSNTEILHSVAGGGHGIAWTSPANNTQRSDVLTLRDVVVNANGTGANGLVVDGMCQTLRVDNCGLIHCGTGMVVQNSAGSNQFYPQFFFVNDLEIDGVDNTAVAIYGGREFDFVQLNTFNAGGAGADTTGIVIFADGTASVTSALRFTNCRFAGARGDGVYCEAKQVDFVNCYVGDNSVQGSGLHSGVILGNNGLTNGAAVGVNFIGGRIGSVFGDIGNQAWGVTVAAGCSRINVMGVDFSNCVTGAIEDNTGGFGNVRWSGCFNINGAPLPDRLAQIGTDPSGGGIVEGMVWENVTSFTNKEVLNGAIKTVTVT